jgi:hypothetical protein
MVYDRWRSDKDIQRNMMNQPQPIQRAPRTDFRTRDVVNQAIAAIPSLGLQQVAEFLNAMNVPPEVAIRTLVYPSRRRNY